jgi:hypothetical protein
MTLIGNIYSTNFDKPIKRILKVVNITLIGNIYIGLIFIALIRLKWRFLKTGPQYFFRGGGAKKVKKYA